MKILETDRLILRTCHDEDLQPMLAINQDPKVMEYFPSLQDLDMTKNFLPTDVPRLVRGIPRTLLDAANKLRHVGWCCDDGVNRI